MFDTTPIILCFFAILRETSSACGPKKWFLSSFTPRKRGVGSCLMASPSTRVFGIHFASLLLVEKKLDSLLVALSFSFHFFAHSATLSTALCADSSACSSVGWVDSTETVLSPLLFLFYINDLVNSLPLDNINALYTDDVSVLSTHQYWNRQRSLHRGQSTR